MRAARSTGLHFQQGNRAPLYCCSTGKLFLAEMEPAEFETWLKSIPRQPLTRRTLVSERTLRAAANAVRAQGWALTDEQLAPGVRSVAAPLRDSAGRVIAAMNVTVHAAETPVQPLTEDYLPLLLQAARNVGADFARYHAAPVSTTAVGSALADVRPSR